MELQVIRKRGERHGGKWDHAKAAVLFCVFIRKFFVKLTVLPCITPICTLLCINASSSPSLLFLQYHQPHCLVQHSCYILYHIYDLPALGDFTLACRVLPAQLGTHTLNLHFCWHRWEKEKPISGCFLFTQCFAILPLSRQKKSVNHKLKIEFSLK